MKTKLITMLFLLTTLTVFVGCDSADERHLEGTWKTTETEDDGSGGTITMVLTLVLKDDNTYTLTITVGDQVYMEDNGTWEVKDERINVVSKTDASLTGSSDFDLEGDTFVIDPGTDDEIVWHRQ